MAAAFQSVISILISLVLQMSAAGTGQLSPDEAAADFLQGLSQGENIVIARYIENDYVNLIENAGDEEVTEQLYKSLFRNFSYKVTASASKSNVAVAKIDIVTDDFSKVLKEYSKESYKYITSNLYDDSISNKKKLNRKCLDIYIANIDEAADGKDMLKTTIYLPMVSDEHNGWEIMVDDELMKSIFGGLVLPESE